MKSYQLFLWVFLWLVAQGGGGFLKSYQLLIWVFLCLVVFLWLVAQGGGFSSELPAIPMGFAMARDPREGVFLEDTTYSYGSSCGAIPIGIYGAGRIHPSADMLIMILEIQTGGETEAQVW